MGKFQFPKINLDSVQERFKENLSGNKKKEKDPNLYVLTKDKTGSGSSVIRFLPGKTVNGKEPLPYSVIYRHTLQAEKGGSFVSCICPTTVGGRCPICEWNKMMQSDWVKSHGTYRKRKYLSNVLIEEEQNEDLIGKVMMMEYGAKIMSMLEAKLYPKQISGKTKQPLYYYDWDKGANFELVLTNEKGQAFPSWDNSEFILPPEPIYNFLEKKGLNAEDIYNKLFDTEEVVRGLTIESYETLKAKLNDWCVQNGLPTFGSKEMVAGIGRIYEKEVESATEEEIDEVANQSFASEENVEETKQPPQEEQREEFTKEDTKTRFKKFKSFMSSKEAES